MRVAFLTATAQSGDAIGNQLAEKVAFFLERGADVRVFLDADRRLHPTIRPHAEVHRDRAEVLRFLNSADLVIVEYSQSSPLLDLLPTLVGGRPRIVFDYHGVTPPELGGTNHREALQRGGRQRGLVWCTDAAVIHSQFARRELLGPTGFPEDCIARLGYPVDTDWFCPGSPSRSLRAELGLEQATILLFVGRLAPNKRVPILIEALATLHGCTPPIHAVVLGDDTDIYQTERRRCAARATELGVADRLHFMGHVDDVRLRDAYRSADLFVTPSRHEGFCIPVVEAMACGLPVIAARAGALPETVGDAGITFTPDDADDLARQVLRVLGSSQMRGYEPRPLGSDDVTKPETRSLMVAARQIAVVACRYGPEIVGGAEASLRTIAETLHQAGHSVEVFATCMTGEQPWSGQAAEGTATVGGVRVHRFRLDPVDPDRQGAARQEIEQAGGAVPADVERDFLAETARSSRMLAALDERRGHLDAVIVGPYLGGLTFDVAQKFAEKTLLLPCFHDEPFARLETLRSAYREVGGILYHSSEEQSLAEIELEINHPGAVVCGTHLEWEETGNPQRGRERVGGRRYVLYGGRYSPHKNLPTLLDWARRYSEERPGRFVFAFCGEGEFALPREDWLRDLGCVDRATQRDVLAGADVLVQLSRLESLSLAALEAWAEGVPVVASPDCAVLAGHIERGGGGQTVADYEHWATALDDLWDHPERWRAMGRQGRDYVQDRYGSSDEFAKRLIDAIRDLGRPLGERMRLRGRQRAERHNRTIWRERFAALVEEWLDATPRSVCERIEVAPRVASREVTAGTGSVLVSVRIANRGSHAVVPDGPARVVLRSRVVEMDGRPCSLPALETPLAAILVPGQTQTVAAMVPVPERPGDYTVRWRVERPEGNALVGTEAETRLLVAPGRAGGVSPPRNHQRFVVPTGDLRPPLAGLSDVQAILAAAAALQRLPDDYLDVTEGWLAHWKRWVKRKLLHNFRRTYVDVLSRQQSAFNRHLLTALHELAETTEGFAARLGSVAQQAAESQTRCAALEERVARLEALLKSVAKPEEIEA